MSKKDLKNILHESKSDIINKWKNSDLIFQKIEKSVYKEGFFYLLFTGTKFKMAASIALVCLITLISFKVMRDEVQGDLYMDVFDDYVSVVQIDSEGTYSSDQDLESEASGEESEVAQASSDVLEEVFYLYEHLL